jgi:DNA-binding MarR family transcriptional regulator
MQLVPEELQTGRKRSISAIARGYAERFPWLHEDDAAITYLLLDIHPALLAAAVKAFGAIGQDHTRARYGILRSLLFAEDERLTHNSLVELLAIPPSTVSFLVDALEKDGLVERKAHRNRRAAWIHLTSGGRAVAEEMVQAIARSMSEMTSAALSPTQREEMRTGLLRFLRACEEWNRGTPAAKGQ